MENVRNRIITISGEPASGKSTVVKSIKEKYKALGFKVCVISTGDIFRQMIKLKYGEMYPDKKNANLADIQADEGFAPIRAEIDSAVDGYIKKLGERINNKERPDRVYIIDSRLAWNNIPDAYAVRLTVDERIAGERVFVDKSRGSEDSYGTVEEAVEKTRQRKEGEIKRYKSKYGIDLTDPQNYDLIVNTSYSETEELAGIIIKGEESYREGEEYPKNWASPACFIGTQSERQTWSNDEEAGCTPIELSQRMKEEGFDPIKGCIEVLGYKGEIFVNNGHNRCMARLASGGTLIPYRENKDPMQINRMQGDMENYRHRLDWAHAIRKYAIIGRIRQFEDFSPESLIRNGRTIKVGPGVIGGNEDGR